MEKLPVVEDSLVLSKIFNITEQGFKELILSSLNLDQLFYLECTKHSVDIRDIVPKDRLLTWKQSLVRKGFLTEAGEITVDGNMLLTAVGSGLPFKGAINEKRVSSDEKFQKWWETYPSSDIFEYKGRSFDGHRSLKLYKEKCKLTFNQIINEGEVTAEDLIRALECEVTSRKEESVRKKENMLKYMKSTNSYLNSRMYEGFLEISKVKKHTQTKIVGEDI